MEESVFERRATAYSSGMDLREVVASWASRWAGVLAQAKYGELGGVPSRHYAECREHPERLAMHLKDAFPVHLVLDNRDVRSLAEHGLVLYILPGNQALLLDVAENVWARRAY